MSNSWHIGENIVIWDKSDAWQPMEVTNRQTKTKQSVHDTLSSTQPITEHQKPPTTNKKVPFTPKQQRQLMKILGTLDDDDVDEAFACWRQIDDKANHMRAISSEKERKAHNNFKTMDILTFFVTFAGKKERDSLHEKPLNKKGH